jgi:hypothetical protein
MQLISHRKKMQLISIAFSTSHNVLEFEIVVRDSSSGEPLVPVARGGRSDGVLKKKIAT